MRICQLFFNLLVISILTVVIFHCIIPPKPLVGITFVSRLEIEGMLRKSNNGIWIEREWAERMRKHLRELDKQTIKGVLTQKLEFKALFWVPVDSVTYSQWKVGQ